MWTISTLSRDLFHTLTLAQCRFPYVSCNHVAHTNTKIPYRSESHSPLAEQEAHLPHSQFTIPFLSASQRYHHCKYVCVCCAMLYEKKIIWWKWWWRCGGHWGAVEGGLFIYTLLLATNKQIIRNAMAFASLHQIISSRSKENIRFLCLWLWCPSNISYLFWMKCFFVLAVVVAVSVGTYWHTDCEQHTHYDALRQCNNNNITYQWPIRFPSEFCATNTMFGMASNFNAHFVYTILFVRSCLIATYSFLISNFSDSMICCVWQIWESRASNMK